MENINQSTKEKQTRLRPLKELFEWLELIILSTCIVFIFFTVLLRPARVNGHSMENTLQEYDFLIVSDLFYTPSRGDIIVFDPNPEQSRIFDTSLVKRVIATGGEWIDIDFDNWQVKISSDGVNWEVIPESYVKYMPGVPMRDASDKYPMQIPNGYLFVMGDNRNGSSDSRSSYLGLVDERYVLGRVYLRLFPIDRMEFLN
jgi:signal peptidase I